MVVATASAARAPEAVRLSGTDLGGSSNVVSNGGDTVTLSHGDPTADPPDPDVVVVDSVVFGEPATPCLHALEGDTSYTRAPDGGAGWRSHLSANPALAQSPGLRIDGTRF